MISCFKSNEYIFDKKLSFKVNNFSSTFNVVEKSQAVKVSSHLKE